MLQETQICSCITFSPEQAKLAVGPNLGSKCLTSFFMPFDLPAAPRCVHIIIITDQVLANVSLSCC